MSTTDIDKNKRNTQLIAEAIHDSLSKAALDPTKDYLSGRHSEASRSPSLLISPRKLQSVIAGRRTN